MDTETTEFFDKSKPVSKDVIRTLGELEVQVSLLKSHKKDKDVLECVVTKEVLSQLLRENYTHGKTIDMMYKDVHVYEEGFKEKAKERDEISQTKKVHGSSKLKIQGPAIVGKP